MVDFVADHQRPQRANLFEAGALDHIAGRVRRTVDENRLRARRDLRANFFWPILKAVALVHRDINRRAAAERNDLRIAGVAGVRQDHLVARIAKGEEDEQQRGARAHRHQNRLRINARSVTPCVPAGDGLAQIAPAEAVRVMRFAAPHGFVRALDDARRRIEVRLAHFHVRDVDALRLHRLGLLQHLHHQERRDLEAFAAGLDHDAVVAQ